MKLFSYWFYINFYPILLMFSLFLDCELSLILYNFLILHFVFGLVAIFNDYVYKKQVRVLLVFIIKILAIDLSCFFFEMVF